MDLIAGQVMVSVSLCYCSVGSIGKLNDTWGRGVYKGRAVYD